MPRYNYVCNNEECANRFFELKRPIDERNEPIKCPTCAEGIGFRMENDFCTSAFVTGMFTARNSYGLRNLNGSPAVGDLKPLSEIRSSTAKK